MRNFPRAIGYSSCCLDSIILFGVIVFTMVHAIIVLKLFIYSELYKHYPNCYPILYFFGQKNGCKQMVGRYAHVRAMKYRYGNNNQLATQFIQPTKRPMTEIQKIKQQLLDNQKCDAFTLQHTKDDEEEEEPEQKQIYDDSTITTTTTTTTYITQGCKYVMDAYIHWIEQMIQSLNRNVVHISDEFILPPLVKQFSFFSPS